MATIIEIQESKMDHISEYAEKVVKYGKKLMECLDEIGSGEHYAERYGRGRKGSYGFRHDPEWEEDKPYSPRYY